MADSPKTALPKTPMSGADILVQCLINEGVDTMFAYPGGASMPLHQSLTKVADKIRTILPRHEQGGGFMAHGYTRTTGKVSLCMSTSGPGATNFVTILADAKMDSIPIIAITGQVGTKVIGTDAFQETPIVEVCRPVTKHHYLVHRTEDITRVVKEAFYLATSGRPGPIIIDIPKDVQLREIVPEWDPPMNIPGYVGHREGTKSEYERIIDEVRRAKKPVIYGGGGIIASDASDALIEFAEKTGIPVALTVHGLGGFPNDHYLCLQMLGMHGTVYSNLAINDADLVLAFGVRFDDRVTGKLEEFIQHGRIVHVDIDPSELNKNKHAHVAVNSDLRVALEGVNELLKAEKNADLVAGGRYTDWMRQIDEWRETEPLRYQDRSDAILPQYAIQRMAQLLKSRNQLQDTIITTGVGQHQMWSAQYFPFSQPRTWITSGGLGTMGFGLPAAIGAKVANPDKIVIDIDGDGSFLMNIQELACAHVEKIPVKILLLNNQHLGMVVQWEDRFHGSNRGHTYLGQGMDQPPYPDFGTIAKGFGVQSRTIRAKEDFDAAMNEMLDCKGPYLLNVMVPHQEHVLPMIPSGSSVKSIIKEPMTVPAAAK